MKTIISESVSRFTPRELTLRIKHTQAYHAMRVELSKLSAQQDILKANLAKAAGKAKETARKQLAKLHAKKLALRDKAAAYKEKHGAHISNKSVAELQQQLKVANKVKDAKDGVVAKKPVNLAK